MPRLILPDLRRSIGPGRRTWHDRTYDRGRSNDKHRRVSSKQKGASATGVLDAFGNNPSLLDANHPAFRSSHSHVPHARNTQRESKNPNEREDHAFPLPTNQPHRETIPRRHHTRRLWSYPGCLRYPSRRLQSARLQLRRAWGSVSPCGPLIITMPSVALKN